MNNTRTALFSLIVLSSPSVFADGPDFERMVVYGRQSDLIGDSISASEGVIGYGDIEIRPIARAGEILEFVPGMVVTQHSGSGKANQYFLRGFNLDHGTDFSILVDGMPVNMRSHGHGQGYSDLNFITPEFIQRIDYQKGPYRAIQGTSVPWRPPILPKTTVTWQLVRNGRVMTVPGRISTKISTKRICLFAISTLMTTACCALLSWATTTAGILQTKFLPAR